jgi:hypothetical protein
MGTLPESRHVLQKQSSHSKKGLRPPKNQRHAAGRRRGDDRGRAGITDASMFLPYMERRGRHEPTNDTGWNFRKNGDEINLELREYGVLGDISEVRCAYLHHIAHSCVSFVKHVTDCVSVSKNKSMEKEQRALPPET